jgi:hypothetical protein
LTRASIHLRKTLEKMDHRVKPGDDEGGEKLSSPLPLWERVDAMRSIADG